MLNITDLQKEQTIIPVLRLGFRVFFLFGSLFSLLSIIYWLFILQGEIQPAFEYPTLWWHSHEMLFGFVYAIITGFLLTAVQNWTSTPGLRGKKLAALFLLWISARLSILFSPYSQLSISIILDLSFYPVVALFLGLQLYRVRQYRNMIFIPILLLMTLSNLLSYLPFFNFSENLLNQGLYSMTILVVMLVALLGGRVIPMFTANGTGTLKVLPIKSLEVAALLSLFIIYLVFILNLSQYHLAFSVLTFISAGLHLFRWLRWKPWITFKVPLLWSLHFTMVFIPIGLVLLGLHFYSGNVSLSVALHAFTVGVIGGMILAMMSRVSLGHSGRPLQVKRIMQVAFICIIVCAVVRTFLVALFPVFITNLWFISGLLWSIAFSIFIWVYFPILTSPRVDGRPG